MPGQTVKPTNEQIESALPTIRDFFHGRGLFAELRELIGDTLTTWPGNPDLAHYCCLELERLGEIERWHEEYGGPTQSWFIVWTIKNPPSANIITGPANFQFGDSDGRE